MVNNSESLPTKNKQYVSPFLSNSSAPAEGSSVFYSTLTLLGLELPISSKHCFLLSFHSLCEGFVPNPV